MTGTRPGNPAQHFGKQLRKERLARGWSLPELSQRTGVNAGHLSRIETGRRPPTEKIAAACDEFSGTPRVVLGVLCRVARLDADQD